VGFHSLMTTTHPSNVSLPSSGQQVTARLSARKVSVAWGNRAQHLLVRNTTPKVHCRIYKPPPPVTILSQLDPVHTPTSRFLKIHLNIIITSTPGSRKRSLSFRFSHQTPPNTSLTHTRYMPRPSNSSRFLSPE
jgi:hypothetical protein